VVSKTTRPVVASPRCAVSKTTLRGSQTLLAYIPDALESEGDGQTERKVRLMPLFLTEQIVVPKGTRSVYGNIIALRCRLQRSVGGVTLEVMKKPKPAPSTPRPKDTFTQALASVLSASKEQIQETREQAKNAKFSSHTRYKYVPEDGQS